MKRFLITISAVLLFTLFSGVSAGLYGEYHIAPDKKLHLEAGIIIGAGSYFIGTGLEELAFGKSRIHPAIWSIGMAGLAGAGKEIVYDDWMGRGNPDVNDFYYTVIGGAISGLTLTVIEIVFKKLNSNVFFDVNPKNKNIAVLYRRSY